MIYPWQAAQWEHYQAARSSHHLSHALLLTGSDGVGKHHFANILASSLLCEQPEQKFFACGHCKSCRVRMSHAHPDFKRVSLVEGKKVIPVDAIRKINNFLMLSRSYQGYRVVIIEHVDKMNINAANSLLKSLEEPAANTVIILVVDQLSALLPTIKSRCQIIHMIKPTHAASYKWLKQQSLTADPTILLNLADDKPLLALQLDQQPELIQQRNDFANDLISTLKNTQSITVIAKKLEKLDIENVLNWQLTWVQQLLRLLASDASVDASKNRVLIEMYTAMQHAKAEKLWDLHNSLIQLKSMTEYPLNRLIFIESMLLLWRDFATSR